MTEQAAVGVRAPLGARVRTGLRRPAAWLQLGRFAAVGASGYVVNLAVFAALVHGLGTGPIAAATVAFLVAVTNNFAWNRGWTFAAQRGGGTREAPRFLVVSLAGYGVNLVVLELLVALGLPSLPAQALAILAATPLTFVANKLWTFAA